MRKRMIAGNWKMNMTPAESAVLAQNISNRSSRKWDEVDVIVFPPAVDLRSVMTVFDFDRCDVEVGAQNVHWETSGAYTGEISIPMIKDLGCTWSIVGHSERRQMFGETDADVNKKVKALVAARLGAVVCVGESLALRDAGTALEFVTAQVRAAFAGLDNHEAERCVVAYEPIWAIGTGRTATPEQAEEMCAAIRAELASLFGEETAQKMRILYGGSMKPENVDTFLPCENIDGGLIGGASLKAPDFVELITSALNR